MISFLKNHIFFYIGYLVGVSLVAFFAYVIDKGKAKRGAWRIPEKVLLTLSLIGGATGGYVAMNLVRHKTQKWYFPNIYLITDLFKIRKYRKCRGKNIIS